MGRLLAPLLLAVGLLLCTASLRAQSGRLSDRPADRLSSVPHDAAMQEAVAASGIDRIAVLTDGTRETLAGFARIWLDRLTGRTSIHGQLPEYTVLSMMFQPEVWEDARIFPLEHPGLGGILGTPEKWVSRKFVVSNPGFQELEQLALEFGQRERQLERARLELNLAEQALALGADDIAMNSLLTPDVPRERLEVLVRDPRARREAYAALNALAAEQDRTRPLSQAGYKLAERIRMIQGLSSRFYIVPDPEDELGNWIEPSSATAEQLAHPTVAAGLAFEVALHEAFQQGRAVGLREAVDKFQRAVEGTPGYPGAVKRDLKNAWHRHNPMRLAAFAYLLAAITWGFAVFLESPRAMRGVRWMLLLAFVGHTGAVGMRLYLTGHMPVSNMYESVTFTAWAATALALWVELRRGSGTAGFAAAVLAFLALMLTSFMPLEEVRIHPLRAVLRSYWLNIHVTVMLLSYGAFALAAFFAGGHLVKSLAGRDPLFGRSPAMPAAEMEELAYRLVQVGWPLLTLGIALGAVWANTAWGRFWGWDPKETWAFITWIIYTIYLHTRMVMGWRDRVASAMCVAGFVMVLLTWFGVSYLPWFAGGLHSYATPG